MNSPKRCAPVWYKGILAVSPMGVILSFGKHKAVLRRGEWRCADLGWEQKLNRWTEDWLQSGDAPPVSEANQEVAGARAMAERTGGRVMYIARGPAEKSVRDFFAKRQFRLAFPDHD